MTRLITLLVPFNDEVVDSESERTHFGAENTILCRSKFERPGGKADGDRLRLTFNVIKLPFEPIDFWRPGKTFLSILTAIPIHHERDKTSV